MHTGLDFSAFEEIIIYAIVLLQGNVGKNYTYADGNGNQNIETD